MANVPTPINSSFLPSTCAAKMRDFGIDLSGKNSMKSIACNVQHNNVQLVCKLQTAAKQKPEKTNDFNAQMCILSSGLSA
jgi:hypothetical protein